jgi:hypothetical protein
MFNPCTEYSNEYPLELRVAPEAIAKVQAIEERALECGWSLQALYQNRGRVIFPCGQDWGLVCFLDDEVEIGAVTRRAVSLVRVREGNVTRFYRVGAPL